MTLRLFFARRGDPKSITTDNVPTFTLAESIFNDLQQAAQKDAGIARELSDKWNGSESRRTLPGTEEFAKG
ncbi:hypothetical protein ANCDUO_06247 [Ancylostoma duodenale]|uniref:Uncharacterized protein n=1 Tax=Ancylostoma duodenale TaxID=51022 RepID=A0A0C2D274_9BILA|nr:hypothetical protein ANCDUO_06247 [Ancylostoma duodenale]